MPRPPIDLTDYKNRLPGPGRRLNGNLRLTWPMNDAETGILTLDMTGQRH